MIYVEFYKNKKGFLKGFNFKGHAEFEEYGKDIVCAAVSCAVRLCCNGLTEIAKKKVLIKEEEGKISLKVSNEEVEDEIVQIFLKALKLEIGLIEKSYSENVELKVMEV